MAVVANEFEEGLVAVAAPVRDVDGRLVAVLNVSGPTFRLGRDTDAAAEVVTDAANQLTRALGPQD